MLAQPFFMRKARTFPSPGFVITQSSHKGVKDFSGAFDTNLEQNELYPQSNSQKYLPI